MANAAIDAAKTQPLTARFCIISPMPLLYDIEWQSHSAQRLRSCDFRSLPARRLPVADEGRLRTQPGMTSAMQRHRGRVQVCERELNATARRTYAAVLKSRMRTSRQAGEFRVAGPLIAAYDSHDACATITISLLSSLMTLKGRALKAFYVYIYLRDDDDCQGLLGPCACGSER